MLAVYPFARNRTLNTLFRKFYFGVRVNRLMRTATYFFQVRYEFGGKRISKWVAELPSPQENKNKKGRVSTLRSRTSAPALLNSVYLHPKS
jgi:hypothetical protein